MKTYYKVVTKYYTNGDVLGSIEYTDKLFNNMVEGDDCDTWTESFMSLKEAQDKLKEGFDA